MTGRHDPTNDHDPRDATDLELGRLAMATVAEHERTVTTADTEAALAAVRHRVDTGETGGRVVVQPAPPRSNQVRWLVAVAAAAAAVLAGGILVATRGGDGTIAPGTVPVVSDPPVPTVATTVPAVPEPATSPTTVPSTSASTSIPVDGSGGDGAPVVVDAAAPPALVQPVAFASVPWSSDQATDVAIGDTSVVLTDGAGTAVVVPYGGAGGEQRTVELAEQLTSIAAGPGDVLYGIGGPVIDGEEVVPSSFRFVAIALDGPDAGQVVGATEIDPDRYLELPPFPFGHGASGIIDRVRSINETVLDYVSSDGSTPGTPGAPLVRTEGSDVDGALRVSATTTDGAPVATWSLDIRRDPAHAGLFAGPGPAAPTSGGRVVYSERIGATTRPDGDFGPNTLPVVAILEPDGSGRWVRLPEDWDVVASDVWGTVLLRRTADTVELALLDDVLAGDGGAVSPSEPGQPTALVNRCAAEFECTQVDHAEDGRIVTYDPVDDLLRLFDPTGVRLDAEIAPTEPLAGRFPVLEHVGPDDMAYVTLVPAGAQDPIRDLVAIPLSGPSAGTVLPVAGGLDGSGDSTLVARKAGLAVVPCCGPDLVRPAPDSPLYHWIDRSGNRVESDAPTFRIHLGAEGNNLARVNADTTSTFFPLPALLQSPRDIPWIVATDDGGALAMDSVNLQTAATTVVVHFRPDWPDVGIDNGDVYLVDGFPQNEIVLEPAGTVLVANGDRFDRRTLDQLGAAGWPGRPEVAPSNGVTAAPGLNEYIDARQPWWAADPSLFAYQIAQSIGPNENVQVDVDEATGRITIVTSGFLDDSVAASRQVVRTERAADGLLRFVDGTFESQCQPGRGHQDFTAALCI